MSEFDSLYDDPVDAEAAAVTRKRNMAPGGTYVTDPDTYGEFTVTPSKQEDGRRVFAFFGRARYAGRGETVETALRFRISPDTRPKKDQDGNVVEGKDDLASRMWASAIATYEKVNDEAPKNTGQLVDFLKAGSLRLRTMQGDDDLIVLNITPAR